MTTMTLEKPTQTSPRGRLAELAVERALGANASPETKKAAAKALSPWAERFAAGMDDFIRIPGTRFGIGLDPILGFILPGAGDTLTGLGSIGLLLLGLKERVPTVVLLRMCLNIVVDVIGGLVPFVGDAFDVVWRSNRRNLTLIEKFRHDPKAKPTVLDYLAVGLGISLAVLSALLPIVIVYGLGLSIVWGLVSFFGG